jgi:N-acetylmuramoyl-L-alanine amidase
MAHVPHPRAARPPPRNTVRAAAVVLTAAVAWSARAAPPPSPGTTAEAWPEGCPEDVGPAVLADLAVFERCALPPALAARLRPDYADEVEIPDWARLAGYSRRVPADKFLYQLRTWANPGAGIERFIRLDEGTGRLWPEPVMAPQAVVQLAPSAGQSPATPAPGLLQAPVRRERPFRATRQAELRAARTRGAPLAGLRVAIDPGHYGGALGRLEQHFTWSESPRRRPLTVQEGDLTWRTARELAAKLRRLGARVHLTRGPAESGHGRAFSDFGRVAQAALAHAESDPVIASALSAVPASDRSRARAAMALHYIRTRWVFASHRERMRRAARFRPDLMVSIHFEGGAAPISDGGEDSVFAMVRGNVLEHRLADPYHRFRLLRDALEIDEFNAAVHLAASCVREMSRALGVPVSQDVSAADRLAITDREGRGTGVAAWNGAVLRYAEWPAVLTEGPSLRSVRQLRAVARLERAPVGTRGTLTERYAEGLARGIRGWFAGWLAQSRNDFDDRLALGSSPP